MSRLSKVLQAANLRQNRVRSHISGTAARPRLSVTVSNKHVSAQVIDDQASKTLVAVSTVGQKQAKGSMTARAAWVGTEIAKLAQAKKIKTVAFDRGSRLYHGRVKALADAAREAGLEF